MAEINPRNRHTLAAFWWNVLLLPALHVPFKLTYVQEAFSPSDTLKCWVSLCLRTTFFNHCLRLSVSLLPLHQEKSRGTCFLLLLEDRFKSRWSVSFHMFCVHLCSLLSKRNNIHSNSPVTLHIFQISRENSIVLQELDLPSVQKKASLKDCSNRIDYIYILL